MNKLRHFFTLRLEKSLVKFYNFQRVKEKHVLMHYLQYHSYYTLPIFKDHVNSIISLKFSFIFFNPLRANSSKWSNILKQFVGNLPTNCLSVSDHYVGLAL